MVDEARAQRLDLLARAKFAEDGERIHETRALIDEQADPAPPPPLALVTATSASKLKRAADDGFVEVG